MDERRTSLLQAFRGNATLRTVRRILNFIIFFGQHSVDSMLSRLSSLRRVQRQLIMPKASYHQYADYSTGSSGPGAFRPSRSTVLQQIVWPQQQNITLRAFASF